MRRLNIVGISFLLMAVFFLVAFAACESPHAVEPLPHWFVEVRGTITELDGSPVPGGTFRWEHWTPICDESGALEGASEEADEQGRFQARIGVETPDGCFEFRASEQRTTGRTSPGMVRSAVEIPLKQEPPYDTISVGLTLPPG